jgi:hypothetical protein
LNYPDLKALNVISLYFYAISPCKTYTSVGILAFIIISLAYALVSQNIIVLACFPPYTETTSPMVPIIIPNAQCKA